MTPTPDLMRGVILHFSAGRCAAMALASFDEKGLKSMAQLRRGPIEKFKRIRGGVVGVLPIIDGISEAELNLKTKEDFGEKGLTLPKLSDGAIGFNDEAMHFILAFSPKRITGRPNFFHFFDDRSSVNGEW